MDKIFIEDLMVRGVIGISEKEDDIEDCVNYRTVAKAIIAHIQKVSRFTVEALAADIADICLKTQNVQKVKIKVEKPGAVRFSKSVGVEITRAKKN